jgi:prepilin-type N-terminal cleavage/methylation domain-containing protein
MTGHLARIADSRRRHASRRHNGDGGYSLIEVLIAVMLVGTVIAALAAGMLTMINATRSTSEQQRLQAAVLSYTESLKSSPYLRCGEAPTPSPAAYTTSHNAQPGRWEPVDGMTAEINSVEYWHNSGAYGDYQSSCPAVDQGRQRLTITVTLPGGASASGPVVMSELLDVSSVVDDARAALNGEG